MSQGAIIGLSVALGVLFLILVSFAALFFLRRRRRAALARKFSGYDDPGRGIAEKEGTVPMVPVGLGRGRNGGQRDGLQELPGDEGWVGELGTGPGGKGGMEKKEGPWSPVSPASPEGVYEKPERERSGHWRIPSKSKFNFT